MIVLTTLLLSLASIAPGEAPSVPAGASEHFNATYGRVVDLLDDAKFREASVLAKKLPSMNLQYAWDDSAVKTEYRTAYRSAFDDAVLDWTSRLNGFKVTEGANPDVAFSFSDSLPRDEESNLPKGAVVLTSDGDSDPRLDVVVGLHRLDPPLPIDGPQMQAVASHAIGEWLGLADAAGLGGVMFNTDQMVSYIPHVSGEDVAIATKLIQISDASREAAQKHRRLHRTHPQAQIGSLKYEGKPVVEGIPYQFAILVSNTGDGTLYVRVDPDCSCFTLANNHLAIKAGQSSRVLVSSDTRGFRGDIRKSLVIYTNDPERSATRFILTGTVQPEIAVVGENSLGSYEASPLGTKLTFYVFSPNESAFTIGNAHTAGLSGDVQVKPWEGEVGDASLGIPKGRHKGYRIDTLMATKDLVGIRQVSLIIKTDSKATPTVTSNFSLQHGVTVNPDHIFLGRLERGKARSVAMEVTDLGKTLNIESVTSSVTSVQAKSVRVDEHKWRISVIFDGQADAGDFLAELTLKTDDPNQKPITIPVQAFIK